MSVGSPPSARVVSSRASSRAKRGEARAPRELRRRARSCSILVSIAARNRSERNLSDSWANAFAMRAATVGLSAVAVTARTSLPPTASTETVRLISVEDHPSTTREAASAASGESTASAAVCMVRAGTPDIVNEAQPQESRVRLWERRYEDPGARGVFTRARRNGERSRGESGQRGGRDHHPMPPEVAHREFQATGSRRSRDNGQPFLKTLYAGLWRPWMSMRPRFTSSPCGRGGSSYRPIQPSV